MPGAGATDGPLAGRSAWVLTEGHAGMERPACALAEVLGLDPVVKRVPAPPWGWLPAWLWPVPLAAARTAGAALEPPWPEILISCGRRSVAPALAVRRASRRGGGPGTFAIHVQNPAVPAVRFDAVVAPEHDRLDGPNVVAALGSLHNLTAHRLAEAADRERPRFARLPRPLVAVLVGGPSRAYPVRPEEMRDFAGRLAALHAETGCGLAVMPSRRTGAVHAGILYRALDGAWAEIWDGRGPNPYPGVLGLADAVVVTCDSVNMVTEAAATGKPVYVAMFEGRSDRLARFHDEMARRGHVRPFAGRLEAWTPVPLDEMPGVARRVAALYEARRDPAP